MSKFLFTSDVETEMNKWMDERDNIDTMVSITRYDDDYSNLSLEESENMLKNLEDQYYEYSDTNYAVKRYICDKVLELLDHIAEEVEKKNDVDIRARVERMDKGIYDEDDE